MFRVVQAVFCNFYTFVPQPQHVPTFANHPCRQPNRDSQGRPWLTAQVDASVLPPSKSASLMIGAHSIRPCMGPWP